MANVDKPQLLDEFTDLIAEQPGSVSLETQLSELENWDSMAVLSFMMHVDEQFELVLSPDEIAKCQSVSDLVGLVDRAA